MVAESSEKEYDEHTCGECARFKVPDSGCWYAEDIRQGILRKSDSACDRFFPKKTGESQSNPYIDDEGKINTEAILHDLRSQFTFKTANDIDEIYAYQDGVYVQAESKIKSILETWLGALATTHVVNEVLGHIARGSYVDRTEFNKPSIRIPVQNGVLNLETLTLEPFDPNQILTYKIEAKYDPNAKATKFLKFLEECLKPEDIPTLQEYAGYCLLNSMPHHKIMWFYGVGRNGKTTFINTLTNLFGSENVSGLGLEEFDGNHRFSMAVLHGKMINVSSEPNVKSALQTSLLKKATGDDWIDAEIKCKQKRIKFKNFAKLFIVGNRYPRVNDNTLAFWDRIIIVQWPNTFTGDSVIPEIEKTWTKSPNEMSGILNWMIEGLHRLNKNNAFTVSKSQTETILEFQKASDTTLAFLNEKCTRDKDAYVIKKDLYNMYKDYCEDQGLDADTNGVFSAKLNAQTWIKSAKKRINGKECHVWKGFRIEEKGLDEKLDKNLSTESETPETPFSPTTKFEESKIKEIQEGVSPDSPVSLLSFKDGCARKCSSCCKPIDGDVHDHIGDLQDEPAHLECARQWRRAKGYDMPTEGKGP
jgi:P4 family phage/plasmid primase-like protien